MFRAIQGIVNSVKLAIPLFAHSESERGSSIGAAKMNILTIDIGGSNIKFLLQGEETPRRFPSGPEMTAQRMVIGIQDATTDWPHDVISIGYPGPVLNGQPIAEPHNLGHGWVGFDYTAAFGCPVKIINDAAMQALGSYAGGKLLFLGLGTGLGSAMVVRGVVEPMELAHLPYRKGTFEDYVGLRALKRVGKKKWRRNVADIVLRLQQALQPDYIVLGGGNARRLKELPPGCRLGENSNSFRGGFGLWQKPEAPASSST
jgi:polyphosphate glucokinase